MSTQENPQAVEPNHEKVENGIELTKLVDGQEVSFLPNHLAGHEENYLGIDKMPVVAEIDMGTDLDRIVVFEHSYDGGQGRSERSYAAAYAKAVLDDNRGQRFVVVGFIAPLERGIEPLVLGRDELEKNRGFIISPTKTMSRKHLSLGLDEGGRLHVADMHSTNGTNVYHGPSNLVAV